MEYSQLSKELTNKISKFEKKINGIYFTPPLCVKNNINVLKKYLINAKTVLEPSCGSGEYVTVLHRLFPHLKITCIEYNKTIYNSIINLKNDKIDLHNVCFLQYKTYNNEKYDIIIGNPPYYVMKKKDVDKEYYKYFDGRPNIFILFIIHSISLLKTDGILSFILPKNFLTCMYYDKTRKIISNNFKILYIIECTGEYIETEQQTINLIIQKTDKKDNTSFVLNINNYTIFLLSELKQQIMSLYQNSSSLYELGFQTSVGNIIWNENKNILTDDCEKTRIVYSSDIDNNNLSIKKYNNEEKKNYIDQKGITYPMIVINRGYGVGNYKFNFCLIDEKFEYLIENHLICIIYKKILPHNELIEKYKKLFLSLSDSRTQQFIKLYFGNNAINTTELNYILPFYF